VQGVARWGRGFRGVGGCVFSSLGQLQPGRAATGYCAWTCVGLGNEGGGLCVGRALSEWWVVVVVGVDGWGRGGTRGGFCFQRAGKGLFLELVSSANGGSRRFVGLIVSQESATGERKAVPGGERGEFCWYDALLWARRTAGESFIGPANLFAWLWRGAGREERLVLEGGGDFFVRKGHGFYFFCSGGAEAGFFIRCASWLLRPGKAGCRGARPLWAGGVWRGGEGKARGAPKRFVLWIVIVVSASASRLLSRRGLSWGMVGVFCWQGLEGQWVVSPRLCRLSMGSGWVAAGEGRKFGVSVVKGVKDDCGGGAHRLERGAGRVNAVPAKGGVVAGERGDKPRRATRGSAVCWGGAEPEGRTRGVVRGTSHGRRRITVNERVLVAGCCLSWGPLYSSGPRAKPVGWLRARGGEY